MPLPTYKPRRVVVLRDSAQELIEVWEQVDPLGEYAYRYRQALSSLKMALRNLEDPPYEPMRGKW